MSYAVNILRRAQKELAALPTDFYQRVRGAIYAFGENPRPPGCLKLSGREGWRIRVGFYRVIYEIDDTHRIVTVLHIGHLSIKQALTSRVGSGSWKSSTAKAFLTENGGSLARLPQR